MISQARVTPIRYSSLHRDDELVLAAMRTRQSVRAWRVVDVARLALLPYNKVWRSFNRLTVLGYLERDGLRRCRPRWDRLAMQHRLAVVEAEEEIAVAAEPEPRWVRVVRSVLAHFSGEWL